MGGGIQGVERRGRPGRYLALNEKLGVSCFPHTRPEEEGNGNCEVGRRNNRRNAKGQETGRAVKTSEDRLKKADPCKEETIFSLTGRERGSQRSFSWRGVSIGTFLTKHPSHHSGKKIQKGPRRDPS